MIFENVKNCEHSLNHSLIYCSSDPFPGYSKTSWPVSYNDDPRHSGPFHQKLARVLSALQRNATGKLLHPSAPGDPDTISSVFKQKFNKEMIFLFSFLDQQKQCHTLNKVARNISCNISITTKIAANFTKLWKGTHCPSKPMNKQCYVDSKLKLKVRKLYLERLAEIFITLPLPFKCLLIKSISSVSNYDTSQQQHTNSLKITLQQAEKEAEKLFSSVKLKSKCSTITAKKSYPAVQAAFVKITVQLHNTTQIQWINYFKKESTKIFFEYMTNKTKMEQSSNSNRRVHVIYFRQRRGPLNLFKKENIITDVRKVTKGENGTFTMRFGIKVRTTSGEYKNWGNAKDIARSLRSLQSRSERLKATILTIRKLKKESRSKTELLTKRNEPLLTKEITAATTLFPIYLKNYYKRIKLRHKCYVMWIIGETLNKKLSTVEHLYYTLERISKRNFCLQATRSGPNGKNNLTATIANRVTPRITTGQPTLFPNLPVSEIPPRADGGKEQTTFDKSPPKDSVGQASASTKKEISALEITLFTLLAFTCIAILAFTINCVLFALKSRSYANNGANATTAINNTVLARAVFSRVSTNVQNNEDRVDISAHLRQSQNVSNPLWACCIKYHQDSSPATNDRPTPQQSLNSPQHEIGNERPLQIDSSEDTKTCYCRTKALTPVKGDSEELQTATHSQPRCTAV